MEYRDKLIGTLISIIAYNYKKLEEKEINLKKTKQKFKYLQQAYQEQKALQENVAVLQMSAIKIQKRWRKQKEMEKENKANIALEVTKISQNK